MTILVTGANGFMGNTIVKKLVAQGKPVRAMVRDLEKSKKRLSGVSDKIEIVQGDVRDREGIKKLFEGISAVKSHMVIRPVAASPSSPHRAAPALSRPATAGS